jgi:hypothetical protein
LFIYKIEHRPVAQQTLFVFASQKQKITPMPSVPNQCTQMQHVYHYHLVRALGFRTKETDIGVRRRGMPERLVTQTGLAKYYRAVKMSHHGLAGCCPRDGARQFSACDQRSPLCWPCSAAQQLKIQTCLFNFLRFSR